MIEEIVRWLETEQFPKLAAQWRSEIEPDILPNKLPLKRRFAEYRYGRKSGSSAPLANVVPDIEKLVAASQAQFNSNLLAIERFRDITPALIVAVFDGGIMLEPGNVGPLAYGHVLVRELTSCINQQRLSSKMIGILREFSAPFYDGAVVVGIVDYRRTALGVTATEAKERNNNISNMSGGISPSISPEMHKILLAADYYSLSSDVHANASSTSEPVLSQDEVLRMEGQLLMATQRPLCLDPSPMVHRVLSSIYFDVHKMRGVFPADGGAVQIHRAEIEKSDASKRTMGYSRYIQESPYLQAFVKKLRLGKNTQGTAMLTRFRLCESIETSKRTRDLADAEPMYGLDARKDPSRLKCMPLFLFDCVPY